MNSLKDKLMNIILFPARFFEKLTDKRAALYAGFILVGAIDLLQPDKVEWFKHLFTGKPADKIYFNMTAAVLMIVLLGLIDVIFVSLPLYDLFKYIKRKEEASMALMEDKTAFIPHIASPVKIMKVYIMTHFIIIPAEWLVYFVFLRHMTESSPEWVMYLAVVYVMLVQIWFSAIMTRGINVLYRFNPIFKRLTFLIVFSWNFLFGMVFDAQIVHWLLQIFR